MNPIAVQLFQDILQACDAGRDDGGLSYWDVIETLMKAVSFYIHERMPKEDFNVVQEDR